MYKQRLWPHQVAETQADSSQYAIIMCHASGLAAACRLASVLCQRRQAGDSGCRDINSYKLISHDAMAAATCTPVQVEAEQQSLLTFEQLDKVNALHEIV